VIEISSS